MPYGGTVAKSLLFVSDHIGSDEALGRILAKNFLYAVARNSDAPLSVMLMNTGVRLACEGSNCVDDLRILAENGVPIKVCGTCLDYLGLKDALVVGEVGAMVDGVAALLGESDVLTIA